MQTIINLTYNKGFKWFEDDGIHVKGFIFDKKNNYYKENELIRYFENVTDINSFRNKISETNGMFTVIISKNGYTFLGSDIIRSFPLFYLQSGKLTHISDNCHSLSTLYNKKPDKLSEAEFLASGFTMGDSTLFEDIKQVQPGQIISIETNKINKEFYYSYVTENVSSASYPKLKEQLKEVLNNVFDRMIHSIGNRQVILPLSGGYDSRLIAAMLKTKGIDNVICFTFGKKGLKDTELSEKVAKRLGYEWHFIEYTNELINGYFETPAFQNYYLYATNGASFFYMQEYFAMLFLKENIKIPEESIFIPGHSGDFLGGSQLSKFNIPAVCSLSKSVDLLYKLKYSYIPPDPDSKKKIQNKIRNYLELQYSDIPEKLAYFPRRRLGYEGKTYKGDYESANAFSFFGFKYRLPYWDVEDVNFFRQVPFSFKRNKQLFNDVLKEEFFTPLDINFPNELQPKGIQLRKQYLKEMIKPFLPYFIKKQKNLAQDWANYHAITKYMMDEMKEAGIKFRAYDIPFNAVIIQWYLAKLR